MNNNDAPKWAGELSADMRAFMAQAAEDRKQAAVDRKEFARRAEEDRKELITIFEHSAQKAEEDRKQAEEDRAEAARDRKELTYVIKLVGKVGEKIFGKLTDIADTNHDILLALKGNGRRNNGNRGNGNGRRK